MAELGHFALILGFFAAVYAVLVDLLGGSSKEIGLLKSGQNATIACWLCLTVAIVALSTLLVRCDFGVSYVAEHTSKALPLLYRLSALWAGAAGSLLLWLWLQVGLVVIVFSKTGPCLRRGKLVPAKAGNEKDFAASARAIANFVSAFFLIILIADKSPFVLSSPIPADGAGLNPLLQHFAMVLHPPTLFIGYAALIIPFAWAFATLKGPRSTTDDGRQTRDEGRGMRDERRGTSIVNPFDFAPDRHPSSIVSRHGVYPLFVQARNWTLIAWLFLTTGIVLGAWWAYEELGWGGYWAWDPVENSSLMPWLTATALLHCFRTYKPQTAIARWLTVLSLVSFSLCIFGTFLTRYGLVTSVHAFPEPGLGILFLVLLTSIWVAAAVLWWRKRQSKTVDSRVTSLPGRRFIGLNNWLMVILVFVIFTGTLFPFFSGLLTDQKITLESGYFTKVTTPFGLILLFLLGLCPHLLRHGISKNWRIFGAVLVPVAAAAAWLLTKSLAIPCFIICGFTAINLAVDFLSCSSAMTRSKQPVGPHKGLRWIGSRIAHISVVLIFVGLAGSGAYETEKHAALIAGQSMAVGKFNIKFEGLKADHGPNFTAVTADVTVSKVTPAAKEGGWEPEAAVHVARLSPSQFFYYDSQKQTSEVDIKRALSGDIYVALTAADISNGLVNMRVLIKPLINWIWIGSAGLVLGAGLVLISFYRHRRATGPHPTMRGEGG